MSIRSMKNSIVSQVIVVGESDIKYIIVTVAVAVICLLSFRNIYHIYHITNI